MWGDVRKFLSLAVHQRFGSYSKACEVSRCISLCTGSRTQIYNSALPLSSWQSCSKKALRCFVSRLVGAEKSVKHIVLKDGHARIGVSSHAYSYTAARRATALLDEDAICRWNLRFSEGAATFFSLSCLRFEHFCAREHKFFLLPVSRRGRLVALLRSLHCSHFLLFTNCK